VVPLTRLLEWRFRDIAVLGLLFTMLVLLAAEPESGPASWAMQLLVGLWWLPPLSFPSSSVSEVFENLPASVDAMLRASRQHAAALRPEKKETVGRNRPEKKETQPSLLGPLLINYLPMIEDWMIGCPKNVFVLSPGAAYSPPELDLPGIRLFWSGQ
jgi:hypothetical protein